MTRKLNTVVAVVVSFALIAGTISGVMFFWRNQAILESSLREIHFADVDSFKGKIQTKIDQMVMVKGLLERNLSQAGCVISDIFGPGNLGDMDVWMVDREGRILSNILGKNGADLPVFDIPAEQTITFRCDGTSFYIFMPMHDKKAFLVGKSNIYGLFSSSESALLSKKRAIISEHNVVYFSDIAMPGSSSLVPDGVKAQTTKLAFTPEGPTITYETMFDRHEIKTICLIGVLPFAALYILFALSIAIPIFRLRSFLKKDFAFISDMIKNFYSIGRVPQEAFLKNHCREVTELGKLFLKLSEKITGDISSLEKQTEKDQLTGLSNRVAMEEQIRKRIDEGIPFSLLFCDLDGFKPINDGLGHDTGDLVLQMVASTLVETFRDRDIVSRWGGDEFVILLPGDTGDFRDRLFERARAKVANLNIESLVDDDGARKKAQSYKVGISVGFSTYLADGTSMEDLIQIADDRMYEDKAQRKALGIAPSR